jgi:hypothetical protein
MRAACNGVFLAAVLLTVVVRASVVETSATYMVGDYGESWFNATRCMTTRPSKDSAVHDEVESHVRMNRVSILPTVVTVIAC